MIRNVRIFATILTVLISTAVLGSGEDDLVTLANNFQTQVNALIEEILPGSSFVLEASELITAPDEAVKFFKNGETVQGLEELLKMSDAAAYRDQIEKLKTIFESGKKGAQAMSTPSSHGAS